MSRDDREDIERANDPQTGPEEAVERLYDLCQHKWTFTGYRRHAKGYNVWIKCSRCGDTADADMEFGRGGLANGRAKNRRD